MNICFQSQDKKMHLLTITRAHTNIVFCRVLELSSSSKARVLWESEILHALKSL